MPTENDPSLVEQVLPWYERPSLSPLLIPWLFLLLACIPSAYAVYQGAQLLAVPTETSRTEAFVLNGSIRIANGRGLYPPFGRMPYIIHVYNPLVYLPAGMAGRLFRLDSRGIRLVGRLVSYASTLALALVLLLWVRRDTEDWKPAVLAAVGLFFFHLITLTDFYRFRPESPGLLFTFWGAAVFCSKQRYRLYGAAVLFFTAFLFKQSFIAAPISALLFLLLSKHFRAALKFLAAMTGQLLVFFLLMYALKGPNYFWDAIVALGVDDLYILHHFGAHHRYVYDAIYGLLFALPFAVFLLVRERRCLYLVVYLVVCAVWTIVSAGKIGADYNYYNELAILLLVIVAMALGAKGRGRAFGVVPILLILNFQMVSTLADAGWKGEKIPAARRDLMSYVERYRAMPGKKLITEEIVAVHVGDPVGFDWFLLDHLEGKGLIDFTPLYDQIRRGEYDVLVFAQWVTAPVELKMRNLAENGPYKKTYSDEKIEEYRLVKRESE